MTGVDFDHVEARGLVKVFGPTRALAGLDLRFEKGAITSVEGANGAGKSTLLGILSTLERATRGEVHFGKVVVGADVRPDSETRAALRGRIGWLGHESMLYPDLTGYENLDLFARTYGLSGRARIDELVARFDAAAFADRPVRTYSRGQGQRLALARALLHSPRLLLLDEPSAGLDRASTERLARAVREERDRGAIVVLVTHDADLAAVLANRRVVLSRGRVEEAR
ncbi:MAG: ABC transporter ATP-binding protein [Deltaproteobacteria bacterium]|nr:ABC transporter ATP-binding protein [Deltaproteobacteria bacterium]